MLVFIDESGDPGINSKTTSHLVITLVIFDDVQTAQKLDEAITQLHITTNHKPEFKFSNCSSFVRDLFFQEIQKYQFRIKAIVVDKKKIYSHHLRNNPKRLYNYSLKKIITRSNLQNAKIRLDGSGSKQFEQALRTYIRQGHSGIVENFQLKDSKKDNLIQLADMVAGAIARSYTNKKDAQRWKEMLILKTGDIWKFK